MFVVNEVEKLLVQCEYKRNHHKNKPIFDLELRGSTHNYLKSIKVYLALVNLFS